MFITIKGLERNVINMLNFKNMQGIKLEKFKYQLPQTLIKDNDYYQYIRNKTKIMDHVPDYAIRKIYSHLNNQAVHWESIAWIQRQWLYEGSLQKQFYIYSTDVEDYKVYLRINQFPEEPLYTIVYNDIELFHVNTFGRKWTSDHSSSSKKQGKAKDFEE